MKILDGEIQETLYGWPTDDSCPEDGKMKPVKTNQYGKDQVAYIHGNLFLTWCTEIISEMIRL